MNEEQACSRSSCSNCLKTSSKLSKNNAIVELCKIQATLIAQIHMPNKNVQNSQLNPYETNISILPPLFLIFIPIFYFLSVDTEVVTQQILLYIYKML